MRSVGEASQELVLSSSVERFANSVALKDKKGQAATLGLAVEKAQPVTARGYNQFNEIATLTQTRLLAAGQKPRDLMDVCSFIWRTHAEKPSETV